MLGSHSSQARDFWSETEPQFKDKHSSVDQDTLDLLTWILAEILDNIVPVIHPHSRQVRSSPISPILIFHAGAVSYTQTGINSGVIRVSCDRAFYAVMKT